MPNPAHISETTYRNWFANLPVAQRIYLLSLVPLLAMVTIGLYGLFALNSNNRTLNDINTRLEIATVSNAALHTLERDYMLALHQVNVGLSTWENGISQLQRAKYRLQNEIIPTYDKLTHNISDNLADRALTTSETVQKMLQSIDQGLRLLQEQDRNKLELYLINDMTAATTAPIATVTTNLENDFKDVRQIAIKAAQDSKVFVITTGSIIIGAVLLLILLGYAISHSITDSVQRLLQTVRKIGAGDVSARVNLAGRDELAELGHNFDRMVDERIATQVQIDRDHQQLNESVFGLLDAVADLSERNLTVRAKVTEDATGPLADAINQLAEDTTAVLKQVREVAHSVEMASHEVNRHALSVNDLAQLEQEEAHHTNQALEQILQRLDSVAASAQEVSRAAGQTAKTTTRAQSTVARTMENVNSIRDSVRETSKRLKRLGERSQEISNIVSIINNLSERTTVLALNASMQATAAGEAGRGFSIIAEEIQRLAESSRDSTEQIATLVNNIQQETNITIVTMDQAIEQVVGGSSLAQEATQQMQETLTATNQLATSIEHIAQSSATQADISRTVQVRAKRILEATQTTGREMSSLTELTKNMAEYSQRLVTSVNVFKLEA